MSKQSFNIGDIFGKWTLIEYDKDTRTYLVKCQCGKTSLVGGHPLRRGRSTQCADCRLKARDLTGRQFGSCVVIKKSSRQGFWLTQCECGSQQEKRTNEIKRAKYGCRACGYEARRLPNGEAGFHRKLKDSKRGARDRNLSWNLTEIQARSYFTDCCHYCGQEPTQNIEGFLANGIDRVDNLRGYDPDNCVSCCAPCNRAKDTMTSDEFIAMARRIASKHKALAVNG